MARERVQSNGGTGAARVMALIRQIVSRYRLYEPRDMTAPEDAGRIRPPYLGLQHVAITFCHL